MKRYDYTEDGMEWNPNIGGDWVKYEDVEEVLENLKVLFGTLDKEETTDEGRVFRPNFISSCRALDTAVLSTCLDNLKKVVDKEKDL